MTPAAYRDTPMSDPAWCYSHGRVERYDESYLQCLECGHTYPTAEQLEQDFMTVHGGASLPAGRIFSCAHCAHDF